MLSGDDCADAAAARDRRQGRHLDDLERRAPRDRASSCAPSAPATSRAPRRSTIALLPLFDALFCETNPIPVKAAAGELGWCSPEIRLPLTRITDANRERLQVVLKELEILR